LTHKALNEAITPIQVDSTARMRLMSIRRPAYVEIQINRRAYDLYSARGGRRGDEVEDWLRAEKEIIGA
jgi:Protein of unknown function (DUF2934)